MIHGRRLTTGTAQAETTIEAEPRAGGCASGKICAWENKNYGGDKYVNWTPGSVGTVYDVVVPTAADLK